MHLADLKSYLDADQRLLATLCQLGRVGAQGYFERGGLRKILKRPNHRRIREPDLGGEAMSGAVGAQSTPQISPLAGKPAPKEMLIDVARLEREYFERRPDLGDPNQMVSFGTSGHRGSPLHGTFTEAHILAITQAICEYRRERRNRRPAVHGQGYACGVRPGPAHRARSSGGQQRGHDHSAGQRRHADAGHFARDSRLQPRPQRAPRGRHRDHAFAQSAGGWRLQVQPNERRSRRHRRDGMGGGPRQSSCCGGTTPA